MWADWGGIPSFFGIAMFMFEGNAIVIDIYHQTENAKERFPSAFKWSMVMAISVVVLLGAFSYSAYA
jgi:amino acid permease